MVTLHRGRSVINVWSLKKSFKTIAFSVSSSITMNSFSSGGIVLFEFRAITYFKIRHQSIEDRVFDISLSATLFLSNCFKSLIVLVTLFLKSLKLTQCSCKLVCFTFLRFRISYFISELIHAGLSGLMRVFLLGIHSFAIVIIWFVTFCVCLLKQYIIQFIQGHRRGLIIRNGSVWPTLFLLNVSTALKGTHNYIFIVS